MSNDLENALATEAAGAGDSPDVALSTRPPIWNRVLHSRVTSISVLLILLLVFFAITQRETFLTFDNMVLLLISSSVLFLVSIGLTFVLLVGGFDLSIGALMALTTFILAWLVNQLSVPIVVAMALTIIFGGLLGFLTNGFLIGRLKLSFMVVTLGTMTLFMGLVKLISGGQTIVIKSTWLVDTFSFGKVVGIPIPVLCSIAVFAIAAFTLRYTLFGRDIYAVGGNQKAARLSGINVSRTVMLAYGLAGACAAFGGLVAASRTGSAGPTIGDTIMLQAAAAVLIGGTSLRGGSGSILGTAIGVLFFGVLSNGLTAAGFGTQWQQTIGGIIIVGAALADKVQRDGWASLDLRIFTARSRRT
ncbi:MAG: ABC transporter permease [Actinobacteria bacterium]|nr:ABC transporter permease [Actinomycetota bacterium]